VISAFYDPLPWQESSQDPKGLLHRTSDYFYKDVLNITGIEQGELGNIFVPSGRFILIGI
jgi:hypothetical protein